MATHQPGTWYGYGSGDDDDHVRSAPPTGTTYGDQQYQQQPPPAQQDGHVLDDAQYGGYQHATPPPPPQRDDLQPPPPVPPRLDAFDEEETEISHPMLTESQGWLSRLRARIRSCWGGSDPDDEGTQAWSLSRSLASERVCAGSRWRHLAHSHLSLLQSHWSVSLI